MSTALPKFPGSPSNMPNASVHLDTVSVERPQPLRGQILPPNPQVGTLSSTSSEEPPEAHPPQGLSLKRQALGRSTSASESDGGLHRTPTSIPSRSRVENVVYASAFALAALTAVLAIVRKTDSEVSSLPLETTPRPEERPCTNEACAIMAKVYKKLSTAGNICEDFFTAICSDDSTGGSEKFPGDNITAENSRLADAEEEIFMEKLLQYAIPDRRPENMTGSILDSELQMGKFFLSCFYRHDNDSADDSRKFFLEFLMDLGIPFDFKSDSQSLSMFSALTRLSLVWGINNPLLFVELKPFRATKHYVTVIRTLKKGFDINAINVTLLRRRRGKEENPDTNALRLKLISLVNETYKRFPHEDTVPPELKDTADIVKSVFSKRAALEAKHLRELVLNHEVVSRFLAWRLDLMSQGDTTQPLMSYFHVLEGFTGFPWRQALTYGVSAYMNFSRPSFVVIDRPDACYEMARLLLDARFHRVFRHYLYVWLIEKFRFAMGKEAEEDACRKNPSACDHLKGDNERFCFVKVREYFANSYVSLVSRSLVSFRSRAEVKFVLSLLMLQSARMIRETTFMQNEAKLRAMRLIATMVIFEGSPEYLNEMRAVEYNFEIGRNFFQNIMQIGRDRNEQKLLTFERTFFLIRDRWPHLPISQPEAYYDVDLNSLTVPATLMTFPHHVPDAPLWVTLAGLGWHVVHKMFHIFDSVNRADRLGQYRRTSLWDSKTTQHFKESLKCFNRSNKDIADFYPKHMSYADEAAIDNAAIYVLSQSFDFLDRQMGRDVLPNETGYDYPDIYWVAAVKPFCYTTYVYSDRVRSHMFSRARINYALRNLKKFPTGLKCSADSWMRKGECQAWMTT